MERSSDMADYRISYADLHERVAERSKLAAWRRMRGGGRPLPGFLFGYREGWWDGAVGLMESFGAEPVYRSGWCRVTGQSYSPDSPSGLVLRGPSACTLESHPEHYKHCRDCWQQGYEAGIVRARKAERSDRS